MSSLSEVFEDCFSGKCKRGSDSPRMRLVAALESELPGSDFLSGGSSQRFNFTNSDLFELYRRVCSLKGVKPSVCYNGGSVVSRSDLEDRRESGMELEDVWKGLND